MEGTEAEFSERDGKVLTDRSDGDCESQAPCGYRVVISIEARKLMSEIKSKL